MPLKLVMTFSLSNNVIRKHLPTPEVEDDSLSSFTKNRKDIKYLLSLIYFSFLKHVHLPFYYKSVNLCIGISVIVKKVEVNI